MENGISIWIFLVFVFVFVSNICIYFCPHGKSSPYCFLGGAREGKADICNPQMCQIKCVALLLFDSSIFGNLQPWSWGYNWGRAPTSNILRVVGCTKKHIFYIRWCRFQIMFNVHVVRFSLSSGCTKMFPHWLSWWSTLSGTLPTRSGIQRWQVFKKFYNLAANSTS